MNELIFTDYFDVRTYDLDQQRRLAVPALARLMQEAAMQHVIQLQLSVWQLEAHNLAWVLLRKKINIHQLPGVNEKLRITTYPAGFDRLFTYRDYWVYDAHDQLVASSASTWGLMDTSSRQMARMPDFILSMANGMPPSEQWLPRPAAKLPPIRLPQHTLQLAVQYYDLDFNAHLNNVVYLRWMMECLPDSILAGAAPKELEILYRAEAYLYDQIQAQVQAHDTQPNVYLHSLTRPADGKELGFMRSVF